jgi:hypothetical protein
MIGGIVDSAAGSASATKMYFGDGHSATMFSGGGAASGLADSVGYPNGNRAFALGASAGIGAFLTVSNATSQYQLQGPFQTTDISLPIADIQISEGGGFYEVSAGLEPEGLGIATYQTNTVVQSGGCKP